MKKTPKAVISLKNKLKFQTDKLITKSQNQTKIKTQ